MTIPLSSNDVSRREFMVLAGACGLAFSSNPMVAFAKTVPLDKGTVPDLYDSGTRRFIEGKDLRFIGMPIGGICAGTVYLGGDGRLWLWDIFNNLKFGVISKSVLYRGEQVHAGGGANYIEPNLQTHPFDHGLGIQVDDQVRPLARSGWKDIRFMGEYPKGIHDYSDPECPVSVHVETFSPYVPLNAEASELPAVVRRVTVTNHDKSAKLVTLAGWLENPVCRKSETPGTLIRENTMHGNAIVASARKVKLDTAVRDAIIFEDWTHPTFVGWAVEGDAFGPGPVVGATLKATGGPGKYVAKSYIPREGDTNGVTDGRQGKLTSRTFTIERNFIEAWIGGGNKPGTACINIIVAGGPTLTATGKETDALHVELFDVRAHQGKQAHIEIVDHDSSPWGQIGVGRIQFVDALSIDVEHAPDFGTMALRIEAPGADIHTVPTATSESVYAAPAGDETVSGNKPISGVRAAVTIPAGKSVTFTVGLAWHFPNLTISELGPVGNHYGTLHSSALAVLDHVDQHAVISEATDLWHQTWYDSTLPDWLLRRVMGISATLSTLTCTRFKNGRFYAWEGIGCCAGTCGHVWQYAQSLGRLFPSLERSIREQADFKPGVGFDPKTGMINFRGEYGNGYAADSQTGYILRTYREHQMSADSGFLKRVYAPMKKALEYLIREDADNDGILEGRQHNTLDVDLYGPSSWLTSMYLAALRAGEEMAREMGDTSFADECLTLFKRGAARFDEVFFNGEYYVHVLNHEQHPDAMRIGNGCHIDQLLGQWWAHQLGLGRVSPAKGSTKAMKSLFKYNFVPDIGPFRDVAKPGRWYAMPGETGLVMTSFPFKDKAKVLGPTPTWASMYLNECWTGCEYAAAAEMIYEGLVEEGLRVARAVDDRHSPSRRNPYNEVECSDHYARGMSVYSVFLAACGYSYHGPKGIIGFAPKVSPALFKSAFTAAEGWGSYSQKITGSAMDARLAVRWGSLKLNKVHLDPQKLAPKTVSVKLGTKPVAAKLVKKGGQVAVRFSEPVVIAAGRTLTIQLS